MNRVTIYIDGFNFYFSLKRKKQVDSTWGRYYWIDFVKLFEQFLGEDQVLEKVIYFTASPLNSSKSQRQGTLFNANKLINGNKFELIRGKYFAKEITCPNCRFNISKPEEKRTDVNISVRMMADCMQDKTDIVVLVTSDSDLVPPIEFIQNNFPDKKVRVYFPPTAFCYDLNNIITRKKGKVIKLDNNKQRFDISVMPDEVSNIDRTIIYTIPNIWKQ